MSYNQDFFELIRKGCQDSAAVVAPLLWKYYQPKKVIDVGCGEGWWGDAFEKLGAEEVLGIDGDYVDEPVIPFEAHDLEKPLQIKEKFDLAIALEVAEHLPQRSADNFVADLCALAPVILFSAAIPKQGGVQHINEQWPGYWVERFARHHYRCSGALRWKIWENHKVENWYRQNLMVVVDEADLDLKLQPGLQELFDSPMAHMYPVVHPVLFNARAR